MPRKSRRTQLNSMGLRKRRANLHLRRQNSSRFSTMESLENRHLLAAVSVNTDADEFDGNTASIAALIATPGGTGISLREVITAANNDVGVADTINFGIPGLGPKTILLGSALPTVSDDLTIDGSTQGDTVELFANGIGGTILTITADNTTISDLIISDAPGTALRLADADNATISNLDLSWFGLTQSGTALQVDSNSDNVTIDGVDATNRRAGIYVSGGTDVRVLNSDLSGSGVNTNEWALEMLNVGSTSLPGGVEVYGNNFTDSNYAVQFENMSDLVISDGSVAGTNVNLTDGNGLTTVGAHTLVDALDYAVWLGNVDDSSISNLDLSWTADATRRGTGLYVTNSSDNLTIENLTSSTRRRGIFVSGLDVSWTLSLPDLSGTGVAVDTNSDNVLIQNVIAKRRNTGISVNGGTDVQVLNSDLTDTNQSLVMSGVLEGTLTGGTVIYGNDYTDSTSGVQLWNMKDLVISDGSVTGTNVNLTDGGSLTTVGTHTLTTVSNIPLWLLNVDFSIVDSIDVSFAGPSQSGTGIVVQSNSNDTVIQNSSVTNRVTAISVNGGPNIDILNNDLSGASNIALSMSGTADADIAGNNFTDAVRGMLLQNMTGMTILPGVGLDTVVGTAVDLNNVTNSVIDGLNLSYSGPVRSGTGLLVRGNSSSNIDIMNSTFVNRTYGILFQNNGDDFTIHCNYFLDNTYGVYVDGNSANTHASNVVMFDNRIAFNNIGVFNRNLRNPSTGVEDLPAELILAENNYWGDASGPFDLNTSTGGTGDSYFGNVDADAFSVFAAECVNTPPDIDPGGPYSVNEGGSIALNASGTVDADQAVNELTFEWDLDNDGIFGELGTDRGDEIGIVTTFSAVGLDGNANEPVTIAVTDDGGPTQTATATFDIMILNVAPDFEAGANEILTGGTFTRNGITFTDPGTPDEHTISVDWGDGSQPSPEEFTLTIGDRDFDLSHTYTTDGTFMVQVTVRDDDGGFLTDSFTVTASSNSPPDAVDDVAGELTISEDAGDTNITGTVGIAGSGILANDSDPESDPVTVIEITDGVSTRTTATPGSITLANGALVSLDASGNVLFDPNGQFESLGIGDSDITSTFHYTISDGDGETDTATVIVKITGENDAPTVSVDAASVTVDEGMTAENSGTFDDIDAGANVTITASVGNITQDPGGSGDWSWTFDTVDGTEDGQVVTISANDGTTTTDTTFQLNVDNVAPTVVVGAGAGATGGLFFTTKLTGEVRKLDPDTGATIDTNVGGITGGRGLAISPLGGLYVANNQVITKVDAGGTATTFVTINTGDAPHDLTFDASGNMYVVTTNSVRVFDTAGVQTLSFAHGLASSQGDGNPNKGWSIALRPDTGEIFVTGRQGVRYFDATTGNLTGSVGGFSSFGAAGIAFTSSGFNDAFMYVGNIISGQDQLRVYDSSLIFQRSFYPAHNGNPIDLEVDPATNDIFLINTVTSNPVNRISEDEMILGFAEPNGGRGVAVGSLGTVVVDVVVDEGQTASNDGSFFDPGDDDVSISASIGDIIQDTGNHGTWSWEFDTDDGASESQTVTITADDGDPLNNIGTATFRLIVNNVAPTATFDNDGPVNEGSTVDVSFSAQTDPSTADTSAGFRYAYDYGNDGSFEVGDGTYAGSATNAAQTVPANLLDDGPGTFVVKGRIIDKDGGFTEYTTTITIDNVAPVVQSVALSASRISEDDSVTLTGSFTDPGLSDVHTIVVDWGDGTMPEEFDVVDVDINDDGRSFELTHQYLDDGPTPGVANSHDYTISITVSDGTDDGSADIDITVDNLDPEIVTLTIGGNEGVFPIGEVSFASSFTDVGTLDTHTAIWTFSHVVDLTPVTTTEVGAVTETNGSGTVAGTFDFIAAGYGPGVYTVTLTVTDDDTGTHEKSEIFVIYDPNDGFVTGGGWINSPAGAFRDPDVVDAETLTGKANFGFVSKYKKGANVPTGQTEFQFKAGNLDFHSQDYSGWSWLALGLSTRERARSTVS